MGHKGKMIKGFIVFSDLKGFSTMKHKKDVENFFQHTLAILSNKIEDELNKAIIHNTWGDAIIGIFTNGFDAIDMMLKYRDFFKHYHITEDTKLVPRIAGHFGEIYMYQDPFLNSWNAIGKNVNIAARIEPVTRAGEIYVTEDFKKQFDEMNENKMLCEFDQLNEIKLPKGEESIPLFRMRPKEEEVCIIEKLQSIPKGFLPEVPADGMNEVEKEQLKLLNEELKQKQFAHVLELLNVTHYNNRDKYSGNMVIKLAEICKGLGLYEKALSYIQTAENSNVSHEYFKFQPFGHDRKIQKLKADCISRLGTEEHFKNAADILYHLTVHSRDADTLSMLAAQLKRYAFLDQHGDEPFNEKLLQNSLEVYTEAFSLNYEDFYPAINTAYLLLMLSKKEPGYKEKGKLLARHIITKWEHQKGSTWWLDSTIAQAEMLLGHFGVAEELLKHALQKHENALTVFELQSTEYQMRQYLKLIGKRNEGKGLLLPLQQHELFQLAIKYKIHVVKPLSEKISVE
jgi:class 3 adenylate cyclase